MTSDSCRAALTVGGVGAAGSRRLARVSRLERTRLAAFTPRLFDTYTSMTRPFWSVALDT